MTDTKQTPAKHIVCIGNALMDIIAPVPDVFLEREQIQKGSMTLIDAPRAAELTALLHQAGASEVAGGSASNTAVGTAQLGCPTFYIGRVADDEMGERFSADIRKTGVAFNPRQREGGLPTGRCHIAVTPDGQRSMSTFLGASSEFERDDIRRYMVQDAFVLYLEGYLFSSPEGKAAFYAAAELAHEHGGKVALTLSDSFCVAGHHQDFVDFTTAHVDILFANEDEITALFRVDNFEDAADRAANLVEIAALTRSEKGAVIVNGQERHIIAAGNVHNYGDKLVDTTGAGDQFAAGFLAALSKRKPLAECGRWGVEMATEVITHYGARVESLPNLE